MAANHFNAMELTNDERGWTLTFASALTCVLGSLIICLDLLWSKLFPKYSFSFQDNRQFLICSLSISSGVMLFTSWFKLLPEAQGYFEGSPELSSAWVLKALFGSYFFGIIICAAINTTIHVLTSQSVVHCAHDVEDGEASNTDSDGADDGQSQDHHHHHHHHHHHQHHHHQHERDSDASDGTAVTDEETPLLEPDQELPKMSILDLTNHKIRGTKCVGRCMGYSSVDECAVIKDVRNDTEVLVPLSNDVEVHIQPSTGESGGGSLDPHVNHKGDHHHHVSTRYSHLFSIGLQTALAISVHKIPEGFLTFATTHGNPELGFSVFLALAVHNFCEGFTIAFPLYLAFGKRWLAIAASVVLGGLSQPLGALLAWAMFKSSFTDRFNLTFGILVSVTAGFLSIIGLQMYGASVAYGGKQSVTLAFAFIGVLIIAFSTILQG